MSRWVIPLDLSATILRPDRNSANIKIIDKAKRLVCLHASWNNKLPGVGRTPLFLLFIPISEAGFLRLMMLASPAIVYDWIFEDQAEIE